MLYLFDLDDTLITGYMNNPDKDYNKWEVLPGRIEKLRELQARGNEIAVVTNQGGVAFGHVTEVEVMAKIVAAFRACGLNPATMRVYVCCHDTRGTVEGYNDPVRAARRKPSPMMIREALGHHPKSVALGVLFVGDREEDQQAAQAAGVPFQWAHVFFGS